jgi:hypothetical protein
MAGTLLAGGGVYWLSRLPIHGSYFGDVLPGLLIMSIGLGAEFVAATTAANAGVPPQTAGAAAALFNASQWIGGALGLAIFSAIATARTTHLLAAHVPAPVAFDAGFHQALIASAIFMLAATLFALRTTSSRGEPSAAPVRVPGIPEAGSANHRSGTPSGQSEHVS